jgi:hypothetical protein
MARLIIQSLSEDTIAAPGNRQPNYVVVSVTDANGVPVPGLTKGNFKVQPAVVAPGGALVNISVVTNGPLPGIYIVSVVPIGVQTWKNGVYIFAIAVKKAADQGQSLAAVLLD